MGVLCGACRGGRGAVLWLTRRSDLQHAAVCMLWQRGRVWLTSAMTLTQAMAPELDIVPGRRGDYRDVSSFTSAFRGWGHAQIVIGIVTVQGQRTSSAPRSGASPERTESGILLWR